MRKNLLIIEDDPRIRKMLCLYFCDEGFNILEAETGQQAITIFNNEKIDLIFLDIMIPETDGLKVCEIIRRNSDVPIIMLTAKSQEEDKLRGFSYGADEYITKPFSLKVLAARAHALMKRVDGIVSTGTSVWEHEELRVNLSSKEVSVNKELLMLTNNECELLLYLINNEGIVLSRSQILDGVWGFDYDGDPRTVDTHIKRLRQKLGKYGELIQSIRNRGYCLNTGLETTNAQK